MTNNGELDKNSINAEAKESEIIKEDVSLKSGLSGQKISKDDALAIIPKEVAEKFKMVAIGKTGDVLKVAMVDPENFMALNALRFFAAEEGFKIETSKIEENDFDDVFTSVYTQTGEALKQAVESFKDKDVKAVSKKKEGEGSKIESLKDAPVAKLVEVIISHAVEGKASDIHIEPMDKDYRVRFRVDGVLHVSLIIPLDIGPVIISRVKIMANLKIDEKRKPQDGRFRLTVEGKEIDFRVSSLPVIGGEKVVMRILDKSSGTTTDVASLGLLGKAAENIFAAIKETYGMILLTGPTGSGKSTTVYALLKILNNEDRNIITLEDPVEYYIEGINQSQIKPEIGYTFASGLRTVLRQDPNVIMVGEIRDLETAELSVHAALTGHLMFSTLHTNTAIGAIPRLIDMGIEPFLIASSLRLVAAQRLVRRICDECKEEISVPDVVRKNIMKQLEEIEKSEIEKYGINLDEGLHFYHGKGCDACHGTGLKGRVAIYEVVPVNEEIRNIITERNGNEELIEKERIKQKSLTIKQDGILKILLGYTTLEEIERVTEGSLTLLEEND